MKAKKNARQGTYENPDGHLVTL